MKNYYEILGVEKNASEEDIRRSYFKLAKEFHPDVSTSDDAHKIFSDVNEAYATLSDALKRADYDQKMDLTFVRPHEEPKNKEEEKKPEAKDFAEAVMRVVFAALVGAIAGVLLEFALWYLLIKVNFTVNLLYPSMAWGAILGLFIGADLNFNMEQLLGEGYLGRTFTFLRTIMYALPMAYFGGRFSFFFSSIFKTKTFLLSGMTVGLLLGAVVGSQGDGIFMLRRKKGRFKLFYTLVRAILVGIAGMLIGGMLGLVIELVAAIKITIWAAFLGFLLGAVLGSVSPPNLTAYASYTSSAVKNAIVILIAGTTLLVGIIFSYVFHDQIQAMLSGKWFGF